MSAAAAAAAAKSLQLCPTPCNPIDGSPPGFPSLGFSRQEHWSGLSFPSPIHESGKWKLKEKSLSLVRLLGTPWTSAYQAPPSMGFSRQEYWSGVPLPSLVYAPRSWQNESLHPAGSLGLHTAVTTLVIWTVVARKLEGALESPGGLFKPDFWAPTPEYLT